MSFIRPGYTYTVPDCIVDTIPGARERIDAIRVARTEYADASRARATAYEKLATRANDPLGTPTPRDGVTYAQMTRALDDYHAATHREKAAGNAIEPAIRAADAHIVRGMDDPTFITQHEAIYDAAATRAKSALAELRAAVEERDTVATEVLGRRLSIDGGWFGLDFALRDITAYVEAGLTDPEDDAWKFVEDALDATTSLTAKKTEVLRECQEVAVDESRDVTQKMTAYRAILDRHGMLPQRVA